MNKLKLLISLSITLGLFGCSTGKDELEKLCKKDAGTVIYKQVKAEGFYYESCDSLCWLGMISKGFYFIEMNNQKEHHRYLPEKGLWRIYLSKSTDYFCNAKITKGYNFGDLPDGKCFAARKIDKVTARYKHAVNKSVIKLDNRNESVIGRYVYQVVDRYSEEVLSETILYILDSDPTTTLDGGPYQCKHFNQEKQDVKNLLLSTFIREKQPKEI